MKKLYLILVIGILIFTGCNRDSVVDSTNPSVIRNKIGLFLLCEGHYSTSGTSRLSFYNMDTLFYDNIFKPGNLGIIPDGLIYDNQNLFVTEQGSYGGQGKIYKLDTGGTIIDSKIVGVNPYSLCIANNKIYITNMNGTVHILDKNNFNLIKSVNVGKYPQEILSYNGKIFVCNYGDYIPTGYDSTVSVIDVQSDSVVKSFSVGRSPSSIVLSKDNKILVGCEGANGLIYMVDPATSTKLDSFYVVGGFYRDISIDKSSNDIYFISNSRSIVKLNLATKVSQTIINNPTPANNSFYGYFFDTKNRIHYVANARNFSSGGLLHKYDIIGTLLLSYPTAMAPRRLLLIDN